MAFGLLLLCVGLFMLAVLWGLVPIKGEPPPWYVALPIGLGFCVTGLVMMFGRMELLIDRRRQRIVQRWYLLVPVRTREFMLGDYRRITIEKEIKKDKNGTHTVYPVRLEGEGETRTVGVDEPLSYENARERAEDLARHLGLPVADASTGTTVVRDAAALDQTLRARLRDKGERVRLPHAPMSLRSSIREESHSLSVVIPPAGMGTPALLTLLPTLLFGIVVAVFFGEALRDLPLPLRFRVILTALAVVFFVAVPVLVRLRAVMAGTRQQTVVTATPAFLRVEKKVPMKKDSTDEIPADEIEELFVEEGPATDASAETQAWGEDGRQAYRPIGPTMRGRAPMAKPRFRGRGPGLFGNLTRALTPPACIVVRSDRVSITFGQGLPEEELRYLCAMIEKILAG